MFIGNPKKTMRDVAKDLSIDTDIVAMHIVKAHLQQQYDHGVVSDKADFVDPSTLRIHTHSIEVISCA
ncbi:hypothetical protein PRIPAC_78091 [Pristionchus pacificus]|uniref:Uncharacterized protein n=1 Tax=Pristionchus pacificus TaxID=54126 RepID=A0A2A6BHH5_PRIPA|nr:hypothetical protein PRIPAC_78091 [Pristionchus pacificus]|eukprot:PDM65339.1 hypothetical protein PRIPAC_52281 [Pristionchus pacificus]